MNKIFRFSLILCLIFSVLLTGCGSKNDTEKTDSANPGTDKSNTSDELDLTMLGSTMLYSEVCDISSNSLKYIGRKIRIKGTFETNHDDSTGKDYFFVTVSDTTACCSAGIEFLWNGEHSYPDDYPELQSEIEICGVYDGYVDLDGALYYSITTDEIIVR